MENRRPLHDGEQLPLLAFAAGVCQEEDVPFIYASSASVYGGGTVSRSNANMKRRSTFTGYFEILFEPGRASPSGRDVLADCRFRYFNVYGPRENHKGAWLRPFHFFNQYRANGKIKLFEGNDGYENGEQRRDFISVEDVVKVNLHFLDNPVLSGIFNLGTGRSQTFNDVPGQPQRLPGTGRKDAPFAG